MPKSLYQIRIHPTVHVEIAVDVADLRWGWLKGKESRLKHFLTFLHHSSIGKFTAGTVSHSNAIMTCQINNVMFILWFELRMPYYLKLHAPLKTVIMSFVGLLRLVNLPCKIDKQDLKVCKTWKPAFASKWNFNSCSWNTTKGFWHICNFRSWSGHTKCCKWNHIGTIPAQVNTVTHCDWGWVDWVDSTCCPSYSWEFASDAVASNQLLCPWLSEQPPSFQVPSYNRTSRVQWGRNGTVHGASVVHTAWSDVASDRRDPKAGRLG